MKITRIYHTIVYRKSEMPKIERNCINIRPAKMATTPFPTEQREKVIYGSVYGPYTDPYTGPYGPTEQREKVSASHSSLKPLSRWEETIHDSKAVKRRAVVRPPMTRPIKRTVKSEECSRRLIMTSPMQ